MRTTFQFIAAALISFISGSCSTHAAVFDQLSILDFNTGTFYVNLVTEDDVSAPETLSQKVTLDFDLPETAQSGTLHLIERFGNPVEYRALRLILRVTRIDDLTADIGCHPNLVHAHLVPAIDADLRHFGKVSGVTEVKGDAFPGSLRQFALAPV